MRIHFIAIGGAAMHNLALALHSKGHIVTGSDDKIEEPSKSRLDRAGLLPSREGWFEETITEDLDVIILGMHAKSDNPELIRAQEIGVKIYSYPQFLYEQTKDKTRVVIGGSHGKTSITSMIMHVLKESNIEFDYMVGANIEGFDTMVSLDSNTEIAVFEGDEYLTSPLDLKPKFHWYRPQIALLTGVAWDHINVFPTFDNYVEQFSIFASLMPDNSTLVYFDKDKHLCSIADGAKERLNTVPYREHKSEIINDKTSLITDSENIEIKVFGKHNLQNIEGARLICEQIGVSKEQFYRTISTFGGAARRLEIVAENSSTTIYRDFAHSPSKLTATTSAVKEQFNSRRLVACMELHTFSSLKREFLPEYKGSMDSADIAYVYFSPETVKHKSLEPITEKEVFEAFGRDDLKVFTSSEELLQELRDISWKDSNLLLMSSGTFSGNDIPAFAQELIKE